MNTRLLDLQSTDPRLVWTLLGLLDCFQQVDPSPYLRSSEILELNSQDRIVWGSQTSVRPAFAAIRSIYGVLILLSGTQSTLHLGQLVYGWENPLAATRGNGANIAFENATLEIVSHFPEDFLPENLPIRIFGYSYGGAVAQNMAWELKSYRGYSNVEAISVASPRTGTQGFQSRMAGIRNTRWFSDSDPVRFMPPHVDEVPSILTFTLGRTWRGMDTQVQVPLGLQIDQMGNVTQSEGNPTRLHSVFLSILQWCFDVDGFQSVNHAREEYRRLLSMGIQSQVEIVKTRPPVAPERPADPSPREVQQLSSQGAADVRSDSSLALRDGTPVTITVASGPQVPRYKRKRVGSIWTVQLLGSIKAIGPGKRRAGQIARQMNKAVALGR